MTALAKFYVYLLFRPDDGSPCYVGKGHGSRDADSASCPRNPILRGIVQKAGALLIVRLRENLTEAEAFELEREFVKAIGRRKHGGPLANLTDGGDGATGLRHSDEYRARLARENQGKKWDADFCARVRAGLTPEINAQRAAKLRGKPKSAEHREKIRQANLGKKRSPAAREAMSRAWHARNRGTDAS